MHEADSSGQANPTVLTVLTGDVVLDTNIVLDLFVFKDAATAPLKQALQQGQLRWLATAEMREELARVLTYKQILPRMAYYKLSAEDVLGQFDAQAQLVPVALKAGVTCRDADDQKFIDLAVVRRCLLLSKDQAVLCMSKRLLALGVKAQAAIKFVA